MNQKRSALKTLLIKREYFKSLRILLSAATLLIIANKKFFQQFFVAFRSHLLLVIFHVVGIAAKRECLFSFPDRSSRLKGVVTLGGKV